jgi:histidine triad (HIT) family protein
MADCLFCRIISGEVPSKKVYEDEHTFAFEDLNPQGPTHVLIIPKKHIAGLKESKPEDAEIVGRCHLAGQSVFHLHVHLIGGRTLHWPPG